MYECLLWWMALPALVRIAESPTADTKSLRELQAQIQSRIDAAGAAQYQVMALFELGESGTDKAPTTTDEATLAEQGQPRRR